MLGNVAVAVVLQVILVLVQLLNVLANEFVCVGEDDAYVLSTRFVFDLYTLLATFPSLGTKRTNRRL